MYAGCGGTWCDRGGGAAMPVSACSSGLVVTALVTLLLLPAQYYVPDFVLQEERFTPAPQPPAPASLPLWPDVELVYFPTLDLFFTFTLLLIGLITYLCEWIQRKLMERRIVKVSDAKWSLNVAVNF